MFEKKVPSIGRDEKQADKLAAALLAPSHKVQFTLATTSNQLAQRFGLSDQMAAIRIAELAGIYRQRHNIRRELPAGIVDFLAAKKRDGFKVSSLPPADIVAMRTRQPRYEGDACPNPNCRQFKMIRIGTCMKCDVCGTSTGDD